MNKINIIICLIVCNTYLFGQYNELYLVSFKYKDQHNYQLTQPNTFLSQRALHRRAKNGIAVDSLDLPLNADYVAEVKSFGAQIITQSKWLNNITIGVSADSIPLISALPFVKSIEKTWTDLPVAIQEKSIKTWASTEHVEAEKLGDLQLEMHQLKALHEMGYQGQDIWIGVFDSGFDVVDKQDALKHLLDEGRILDTLKLAHPSLPFYQGHNHGAKVLSVMAAMDTANLIGTAPKAKYLLARTEDVRSEFPVEMDYWVAAAEYADSIGIDVVNTSLGYSQFDDPSMSLTYEDMDGKTARISIAAEIACQKGILVVVSAGNEGDKVWRYITAPADAKSVITVGAVNRSMVHVGFSSRGPTFDGRVKPDVMSLGAQAYVLNTDFSYGYGYGTSFSSPIFCGVVACIAQSVPHAKATEIRLAIKENSSLFTQPNDSMGYGISNAYATHLSLKALLNHAIQDGTNKLMLYPNPVINQLYLDKQLGDLKVYSLNGILMLSRPLDQHSSSTPIDVSFLNSGVYVVVIETENERLVRKIIKQ